MFYQVPSGGRFNSQLLLMAGLALEYIATRLALGAMTSAQGSPGGAAFAQWLPILATFGAALAVGQRGMALALLFGSSVALLSLVLGMSTYVSPIAQLRPERRYWSLVIPVTIVILLAGFRGHFHWYHAAMLLALGGAILFAWLERPAPEDAHAGPETAPPLSRLAVAPAVLLAAAGAWAVMRGISNTSTRALTPELLAATILSALLVLPALVAGSTTAQNGHGDRVVTSICGTVLLNLCLLLPILILIDYLPVKWHGLAGPTPFPLITWRLDTVVLVVLSFALLPVAGGRWMPGRLEAVLLVLIYAAYLIAETFLSIRLLG